ncbi:hypothetical protein [Deinococcus sedimenti]|uniref:Uncharacterized protein n=1 Tax=Deinococcus sedimenti TaxID=1867090 RepID=A0ABQ2S5P3_9DEIO|nr:hypothetical protein [Deinococcus sedimenti]GGS00255.1 hypothetical protein GCM10008960_28640 [Deinococcus sedimenti]
MTDPPPRDPDPRATGPTTPHVTVAFHPPQYAQTLPTAALARLDARLAHLHARTPDDVLRATLRDAARLLGAHLTFRAPGRRADAHPWQPDRDLLGVSVRRAAHLLHLRPSAQRDARALRDAVTRWPSGTLLIARGGVIQAQLNLACDLDRLELEDLLRGPVSLRVHRLRPGGQLDQWATPDWPAH